MQVVLVVVHICNAERTALVVEGPQTTAPGKRRWLPSEGEHRRVKSVRQLLPAETNAADVSSVLVHKGGDGPF